MAAVAFARSTREGGVGRSRPGGHRAAQSRARAAPRCGRERGTCVESSFLGHVDVVLEWQRGTIDGVQAPVGDVDGPVAAGLVLGVGQAHETLTTRGRLHLLEHLAFPPRDRRAERSGLVDLTHTIFALQGDDGDVRRFLRDVGGALAQPPVGRLAVERRILGVEDDRPLLAGLEVEAVRLLFGAQGAGLAAWPEFGLRDVGPQDLRDLALRWCVTGGARLVLSRPLEGVELGLPDGPPPTLPPSPAPILQGPVEVASAASGVAIAAIVPAEPAAGCMRDAIERRTWEVLREQRGLAYDIASKTMPLNAEQSLLVLSCDARPADAGLTAAALLDVIDEAAEGRLPDHHIVEAHEDLVGRLSPNDPLEALGMLIALAAGEMRGRPQRTPREVHDHFSAAGPADVATVARGVQQTLAVLLPADASSGRLRRATWPTSDPVAGQRYRTRLLARTSDAMEVMAGPDGVTAGGATVRFDALAAGVNGDAGALTLVGLDGQEVHLDPEDLRDGPALLEDVLGRVTPQLLVPADDRLRAVRAGAGDTGLRTFAVADLHRDPQLLGIAPDRLGDAHDERAGGKLWR